MDACGVGALPDAADYGDAGANTLVHLGERAGGLPLTALQRLGLGSIVPIAGVPPAKDPVVHGRLHPLGPGKESTTGHWELMGVVTESPMPTYADGFPAAVIEVVRKASGREVLCNRPYNGLEAIAHFGAEHLRTGGLIVYTSQDSVLQIAAHVDVVDPESLYEICGAVRSRLAPEHAVGRVIARPFTGPEGRYERTEGRRDYSLAPSGRSYLQELQARDVPVHTVGKVGQLFCGIGVDVQHAGASNAGAMAKVTDLLGSLEHGFVFTNLVETDQVYGHRHDVEGFHRALREIDACLVSWLELTRPGDMLILTADHGCDVTSPRTDHTREHVPLLARFEGHGSRRHDGPLADVGASVLSWLAGAEAPALPGAPFIHASPGEGGG